jgi:hypothetical protein
LFPSRCFGVLRCSIWFLLRRRYFIRNEASPIHPFQQKGNAKKIPGINSFVLAVANFNHMASFVLNPAPVYIYISVTQTILGPCIIVGHIGFCSLVKFCLK